jgi:hypothetical protein
MPASEYISAFVFLFNFSTEAERQDVYSGTSAVRQRYAPSNLS